MPRSTARRSARALPELVVDRVWRFFCSVRAAVVEIIILALFVLLGTLRGSSVPRTVADALPIAGILTILAIAITICTMNRAPGIWLAIAHPTVTTTHGFLRNAEISVQYRSSCSAEALAAQIQDAMRGKGYRTLSEERHGEIHLYADRWRFSRLATFPFHLALILILVGGIVGAARGFRENELIFPEESVRELGHGTGLSVRLNDFSEVYREDGSPKIYRSDITFLQGDQPVDTGSMTVNNPLTFGDIVFYQSGFGQAVAMRVVDKDGKVLYDDALPVGPFQSKLNPDAPAGRMDLVPAGVVSRSSRWRATRASPSSSSPRSCWLAVSPSPFLSSAIPTKAILAPPIRSTTSPPTSSSIATA